LNNQILERSKRRYLQFILELIHKGMKYTSEEVEDLAMEAWNSWYLCAEVEYKKDIRIGLLISDTNGNYVESIIFIWER
jgi:hypothetical protein